LQSSKKEGAGSLLLLHIRHQVAGLALAQAADRVDSFRGDGLPGPDPDDHPVRDDPLLLQPVGAPAVLLQETEDVDKLYHTLTSLIA